MQAETADRWNDAAAGDLIAEAVGRTLRHENGHRTLAGAVPDLGTEDPDRLERMYWQGFGEPSAS